LCSEFTFARPEKFYGVRLQIFGQKSNSINNAKRLSCHPSTKIGSSDRRARDLPVVSEATDISAVNP
jgi:hypothetical protein